MLNAQDTSMSFETRRNGSEGAPPPSPPEAQGVGHALQVLTDRIEQLEFAIGHVSETFADEAVVISGFDSRMAAIEKALETPSQSSAPYDAATAARLDAVSREVTALRAELAAGISQLNARPVAADPVPALSDLITQYNAELREQLAQRPDQAGLNAMLAPVGTAVSTMQTTLTDLVANQHAQASSLAEQLAALVEEQASRGYTVAETLAALQRGLEALPAPPRTEDIVETLDERLKQRLLDPLSTLSQGQSSNQEATNDLIRRIDVYRQELLDSSGKDATPMARLMAAIHNWQTRQHSINERLSARLDALAQSRSVTDGASVGDTNLVEKIDRLCALLQQAEPVARTADLSHSPELPPAGPSPATLVQTEDGTSHDHVEQTAVDSAPKGLTADQEAEVLPHLTGGASELPIVDQKEEAAPNRMCAEPQEQATLEHTHLNTMPDESDDLKVPNEMPLPDPGSAFNAADAALPEAAPQLQMPGVDPELRQQLTSLGIHTLEDLANADAASLSGALGDLEQLVDLAYLIEQAQAQVHPAVTSGLNELSPLPALD